MKKTYRIIDVHTHIFPDNVAGKAVENIGKYYNQNMWGQGTVDALLESGRKIDVAYYIVHSSATRAGQVKAINNFIAGVVKQHKNFIGFGTLHKGLDDIDGEVERIQSIGLRGIKLHPEFQHFSIDDRVMFPVYRAIEGKLPLLIHMGDQNQDSSSPFRLAHILDRYPNLVVIGAHFGGYQMWDESIKHLLGRNLYMDTSSSLAFLDTEKATRMIHQHGVNKFLFGTDFPMWSHEAELQRFLALDLTEDEKDAVLFRNAEQLFGLNA